jgi:hypothetical protein
MTHKMNLKTETFVTETFVTETETFVIESEFKDGYEFEDGYESGEKMAYERACEYFFSRILKEYTAPEDDQSKAFKQGHKLGFYENYDFFISEFRSEFDEGYEAGKEDAYNQAEHHVTFGIKDPTYESGEYLKRYSDPYQLGHKKGYSYWYNKYHEEELDRLYDYHCNCSSIDCEECGPLIKASRIYDLQSEYDECQSWQGKPPKGVPVADWNEYMNHSMTSIIEEMHSV